MLEIWSKKDVYIECSQILGLSEIGRLWYCYYIFDEL